MGGDEPEVKSSSLVPKAAFSTVSANIKAGSKDSLLWKKPEKTINPVDALLAIRPPSLTKDNPYFDRVLPPTGRSHRPKRLTFQERGVFITEAERMRAEEEWEKLRREVGESLGDVGIDAEVVADLLSVKVVPDMDWWDVPFFDANGIVDFSRVNNLIQRPALLPPPIDIEAIIPPKPLMLTQEEQKKMRRQRRLAEHKEKQEQIKLGLLPPEPTKVKIANIARILGTQSVQEPSKVEAEIRSQALQRHQAHLDANKERSDKAKEESTRRAQVKQQEATDMVNVPMALFRIDNLDFAQWKFKIVKNAQQLELTGCVIYYEKFNVVAVEGKASAVRRYKHLLLDRIEWTKVPPDVMVDASKNKCILVWEGVVEQRSFYRFEARTFDNEIDAKAYLARFGVENYWKLVKDTQS